VSTLSDGNKRYGYCRRFFKVNKPPECYCLLSFSYVFALGPKKVTCHPQTLCFQFRLPSDPSPLPCLCSASFSLFSQLLDIVELKFTEGDKSVYTFLHSVLAQPFPDPGQTIQAQTFQTILRDNGQVDYLPETFRLTRSNDDYEYLEYTSYDNLFRSVDVDKILLIFECLLNERRILLVAKTLNTLTSCMDAVANMAYPFSWQYVFIPILPMTMLSFLGAPMPFLIGILSTCLEQAMQEPMEEGVLIVDIDNNEILQAPEDLPSIMPHDATEKLAKSLKKIVGSPKRHTEFSIEVAHSFLKFWASIFGTYSKYFEPAAPPTTPSSSSNAFGSASAPSTTAASSTSVTSSHSPNPGALPPVAPHVFNFDKFVKSKPAEVRKFLMAFKEYQLYQYFMQEREQWLQKGLLNYCIILRAQSAKKQDSAAAVKAKLKSHVGKVFAAWTESATAAAAQKKQRQAAGTPLLLLESSATVAHAAKADSIDSDSEDMVESNGKNQSPLNSDTTESEDRAEAPTSSSSSSNAASSARKISTEHERPRAATSAPALPPKPKPQAAGTKRTGGGPASTKELPPKTSKPSKPTAAPSVPSVPSAAGGTSSGTASSGKAASSTLSSSSDVTSSTAATSNAGSSSSAAVAARPIPFISRFSFKPTPLTEGAFEKQIWKLCNVEGLADVQIISKEKHKYWAYSPVLFQRLPELESIKRVKNCISLDLADDSVESLLQWVYSDDIFLESAESALELLTCFAASESKGSAAILRQRIAIQVARKLNADNVLRYLKVFSGSNASANDPHITIILDSAKLLISKFSHDEMTPIFRRQLSSVSHTALASVLHLKSSASSRIEIQASIDRLLERSTTTDSTKLEPQKHLIQDMNRLLESGKNSDVTLVFSGKSSESPSSNSPKDVLIRVHSKVLAARSPHLNKVLGLNVTDQVSILNVSAAHFKILLPYIYTGQLQNVKDDREFIFELVQAAHLLDLDTLNFRDALYLALSSKFTSTSVFEFLEVPAQQNGSLQHPAERAVLVGAAAYYLAHHPTIFYRPEKLKSLDPDVWECIFKYAYTQTAGSTLSPNVEPEPPRAYSSPDTSLTKQEPSTSPKKKN